MTTIQIPGHFRYENGGVDFVFGDQAVEFGKITTIEQLRAVLVAIATNGTQASIAKLLGEKQTDPAQTIEELLRSTERSFRKHVEQTEQQLQQAQKEYEAATTNV